MILTQEQVELMTSEECQNHLKLLAKAYPFEKPIKAEVWPLVDDITTTLLYLEDRTRYCQQSEIAIAANKARWADV